MLILRIYPQPLLNTRDWCQRRSNLSNMASNFFFHRVGSKKGGGKGRGRAQNHSRQGQLPTSPQPINTTTQCGASMKQISKGMEPRVSQWDEASRSLHIQSEEWQCCSSSNFSFFFFFPFLKYPCLVSISTYIQIGVWYFIIIRIFLFTFLYCYIKVQLLEMAYY